MTDGKHRGASHRWSKNLTLPAGPEGARRHRVDPTLPASGSLRQRVDRVFICPGVSAVGVQFTQGTNPTALHAPATARRRGLLLQAHGSCT